MEMKQISAKNVLNEAYDYSEPVPFSRGMRVDIKGITFLMISGTASVNEKGESIHNGDFEKQSERMLDNVHNLLKSEGADWKDVVRTTYYVKHMDEHYKQLAVIRMNYFKKHGIEMYPASTCIQATLCRPELLVEMEAIAILE